MPCPLAMATRLYRTGVAVNKDLKQWTNSPRRSLWLAALA
jgi:hypothetical protein